MLSMVSKKPVMAAHNQSAQHCPLCATSYHAAVEALSKEDAFEVAAKHVARSLEGVEAIIEYKFKDSLLLWEAIQGNGSAVKSIGAKPIPEGNMRLAVLGDSILRVALVEDWYQRAEARSERSCILTYKSFANLRQGDLERPFQQTASNANLDRVGRAIGLQAFIYAGSGGRRETSVEVMSSTVEAILGAVYLDSSVQGVKAVMRTMGLGFGKKAAR